MGVTHVAKRRNVMPSEDRLVSVLTDKALDHLVNANPADWRVDGDTYRMWSAEDYADYFDSDPDPNLIVFARERDGALFEFELNVFLHPRFKPNPADNHDPDQIDAFPDLGGAVQGVMP